MKKIKKFTSVILVLIILTGTLNSGCLKRKKPVQQVIDISEKTLTFYGLYDNSDIYDPIIQSFESSHPGTTIVYRKFVDPDEYLDLIINELAEGEGPDIFLMHNTWFPKHYKKLTPAPVNIVTPDVFRDLFVEITANDLIIPDPDGVEQVWGLPMYVDTLALYFNKDHYEDAIPSRGKPASTWEGVQNDVTLLNKEDKSFERFERAAIALGRDDNILRTFDTFMMLLLQYKVDFYNEDLTKVNFDKDPNALKALELLTSFSLPSKKNYSWNKYLSDANSAEKEITTFAKGKVSTILGYSYTYNDIITEINRLKSLGEGTIDIDSVRINEIPQVFDPETSAETREAYASYFVPSVSRTSEYPDLAWEFLATLVQNENLTYFNEKTHRPSASRSLISTQSADPIYGVFASQVGYAASIPMIDTDVYKEIVDSGIEDILNTKSPENVVKTMARDIQSLIPSAGVKPVYVPTE